MPCYSPLCFDESRLITPEGHQVYYSQWGNPKGLPVLFVHGGPGGGTSPDCARFFDPEYYRVILVDQRGCGQSLPYASLEANTTQHLIHDFESIRANLQIDQWLVFGGSWGSTLALVYAKSHPDRIRHLILRGLFLARKQDYEWLYKEGASLFFPEAWQDFMKDRDPSDLINDYGQALHDPKDEVRLQAAKAWCLWEAKVSCMTESQKVIDAMSDSNNTYALAAIEQHYFSHECFMPLDYLSKRDPAISQIPIDLVHGRYDLCCQLSNATLLQQLYPNAQLHIIDAAGHAMSEPGIEQALIEICDRLKRSYHGKNII